MTRELVIELARPAIAAVAPEEAPVFDSVARARLTSSGRLRTTRRRGQDVLGSGLEIVVESITDGALYVAAAMIGALTDRVADSAGTRIGTWVRKLRGRPDPGPTTVDELAATVDEQEWEILRLSGLLAGTQAGIPRPQAEALVEAMLTGLRDRGDG
ncbi:hypothetical protein [Actinokineospora cianjurensis]|uniref:Uncharacterized protein n=1 Tax=Actinokineospora cianjurensis TaxID=585224 RepID=A0A421B3K6_9PSEU|nr:hypothetical protein [Actinokineospora cianjurensis]RLK58944.1 hypothetical protein CLV68_3425 [Actinokineospora cianjurensis]